jgi:hypothetical protein
MKKSLLPILLVLAAFSLTYCTKEKKEATTTINTTTTTTPEGAAAKTEVKTDVAGSIGVAECDVYISKYEKCIMDKVPEAARGMLKQTLDQSRTAWTQAASTPEGKQTLAVACTTALDAAKQSMGAYGCEF